MRRDQVSPNSPDPDTPSALVVPLSYSVEGAMLVLSLGRTKLFELIDSGELGSYKEGKSRRIPHSACEDYIARRMAEEQAKRSHPAGQAGQSQMPSTIDHVVQKQEAS